MNLLPTIAHREIGQAKEICSAPLARSSAMERAPRIGHSTRRVLTVFA